MARYDDRNALFLIERYQEVSDLNNALRVKTVNGLIKDKDFRIAGHGHSDPQSLAHTQRELARFLLACISKTDKFKELCHDVALQIAAANPLYVTKEEVPAEALEKEKEILRAQALNEGKPEKIVERMVEGRIAKYYKEVCLLEQDFVKNPDITVGTLVNECTLASGEKISIRRFVRFERGEGIEKKESNLADEIAAMTKK